MCCRGRRLKLPSLSAAIGPVEGAVPSGDKPPTMPRSLGYIPRLSPVSSVLLGDLRSGLFVGWSLSPMLSLAGTFAGLAETKVVSPIIALRSGLLLAVLDMELPRLGASASCKSALAPGGDPAGGCPAGVG